MSFSPDDHARWIEQHTKLCTKRNVRLDPKNCIAYHKLPKVKAVRVDGFDNARVNKIGYMPIECEDCPGLPIPLKVAPPAAIRNDNKCSPLYDRSAKRYQPPIKPRYTFFDKENSKRLTGEVKKYTKEEIEEYERRTKK